ncbi:MAG: helix-turn-helix domain-containing protein [Candidatus Buchananbacteria bacterium]|jgi:transcriptional regulator with XRE-family HTH domain
MKANVRKLNENIKRLRLKQGISQETLARQADLKLSNLAKLEGGFNSNPTLSTLTALANVLTKGKIDDLIIK